MLEGYYGLLTGYNNDPNLRDAQMRVCLNALEIFPLDAQLLVGHGKLFSNAQSPGPGHQAFETAVKFGQTNSSTWHLCELPEVAASCLFMALQLQEKTKKPASDWKRPWIAIPNRPDCCDWPSIYISRMAKAEQAIEIAQRNGIDLREGDPIILAIRGACKAAKQEWTPALAYLQSAYLMGCHSTLCLRWLAVTLLSNGQAEAANPFWPNGKNWNRQMLNSWPISRQCRKRKIRFASRMNRNLKM